MFPVALCTVHMKSLSSNAKHKENNIANAQVGVSQIEIYRKCDGDGENVSKETHVQTSCVLS